MRRVYVPLKLPSEVIERVDDVARAMAAFHDGRPNRSAALVRIIRAGLDALNESSVAA